MFDMLVKGEIAIEDDTKVAAEGGGREGSVTNCEMKICSGVGEGVWTNNNHVCFITIEFEEIGLHPGFNFRETVGEAGVG